ncbi:hypothetical protein AB0K02_14610 [Streptomyces sp. NPDC049597]|uniref:hypothetical protein n=1 Tax=Streptomyces sp. NPDC049597 TaxID=3155276 RepID=UPI00343CE53F
MTGKRATMAGLIALAGLITGSGVAGAGTTTHTGAPVETVAGDDDMPWGVVEPVAPRNASDDDMPWG